MAKLPRVTNRRFGADVDVNDIGQFGSVAAGEKTNTKDVSKIQELAAWLKGWSKATMSANKYPTMQERNGVDYVHAYQIDYILREGISEYDSKTEYNINSIVKGVVNNEMKLFSSLLDENIGQDLTNENAWKELSFGGGGGLEIGDIGFTQMAIDETKGKRRKLNGSVIIQEQYQQFTNIIKNSVALNPSLACTEAEWQTAVTMSTNGVCEKFVIDDNAGTIRLPKYPQYLDLTNNASAKTATVSIKGNGKTLGLTNGTQNAGLYQAKGYSTGLSSGSYNVALSTSHTGYSLDVGGVFGVTTDASKSGITGSVTVPAVTSEKIKGTYFIQVATGAETEDNIINEIELNNPFSLLDYKYSEYELNNLSWLRSQGQWNSKAVYPAIYELLLKIYNGTETKAGVSVKLHTEEYTDYDFVLNTAEETFMLPIKVKLASGKAVVGNGMAMVGLQNLTSPAIKKPECYFGKASSSDDKIAVWNSAQTQSAIGITTDPTKSGLELSDSDLYLYFYVGETVQNANLINAGRIEEKLTGYLSKNNKAEIVGWGMPDYTAGIVVANTQVNNVTSITYTAPCDGYIMGGINPNGTQKVYINNIVVAYVGEVGAVMFLLNKGDIFNVSNLENSSSVYNVINFYPLKGAN